MKTAVEWLIEQTRTPEWHSLKRGDIVEKAKAMEKEQIINAQMYVLGGGNDPRWKELHGKIAEQYYNETFKTDKG
jgi:hypothetical protein